jgi:hypothetical protein
MQVVAELVGEQRLPWESLSPEVHKKLGLFRVPMLKLLSRDPSERPTMIEFYNTIFAATIDV